MAENQINSKTMGMIIIGGAVIVALVVLAIFAGGTFSTKTETLSLGIGETVPLFIDGGKKEDTELGFKVNPKGIKQRQLTSFGVDASTGRVLQMDINITLQSSEEFTINDKNMEKIFKLVSNNGNVLAPLKIKNKDVTFNTINNLELLPGQSTNLSLLYQIGEEDKQFKFMASSTDGKNTTNYVMDIDTMDMNIY